MIGLGLELTTRRGRGLGPELAGTLPTPTIENGGGTLGAWDAGTRTMSNGGTATASQSPRRTRSFTSTCCATP